MATPGGSSAWSVPVLHGPSSVDNLLTTLVAWARHVGRDPRSFHLSMQDDGRVLLLRGFDVALLRDFLRYAEYSSVPALECGRPTELPSIPTTPPAAATSFAPAAVAPAATVAPESAPSPRHPPTLSSSSIQMVLGTAQLLADRSTDVRSSERWVTSILATPDLRPEEVGLLLRLMSDPELDPVKLALAESEPLRREGEGLLRVSSEVIPETLRSWLNASSGSNSASPSVDPQVPPPPNSQETLLRARIFAQGLELRGQRWKEIADRVRVSQRQGLPELQSLLEGAAFINEEEGRVSWVVPHSNSALVKAIVAYVQESHRLLREEVEQRQKQANSWVGQARRETFAALETARRSTIVAKRLGVELRWVILLSTDFQDGTEEGFGLPTGSRPPWEEPAPASPVVTVAPAATGKGSVKKKLVASPPATVSLSKFSLDLDAPIEAMLERAGVKVSLLRRAPSPPKATPTAPAKAEAPVRRVPSPAPPRA